MMSISNYKRQKQIGILTSSIKNQYNVILMLLFVSFDHRSNVQFNNTMKTNIKGLLTDPNTTYTSQEITRKEI